MPGYHGYGKAKKAMGNDDDIGATLRAVAKRIAKKGSGKRLEDEQKKRKKAKMPPLSKDWEEARKGSRRREQVADVKERHERHMQARRGERFPAPRAHRDVREALQYLMK